MTASGHCAPPDNKPTPQELRNCRPFLVRELELLPNLRVVVVLGKIAFDTYLSVLKSRGEIDRLADFRFGHDVLHPLVPNLLCSYHPSQQNTSTGKLTQQMLDEIFRASRDDYPIRTSSRCTAPVVEAESRVTKTLTSDRTPKSSR